jgi:hypothetical protein
MHILVSQNPGVEPLCGVRTELACLWNPKMFQELGLLCKTICSRESPMHSPSSETYIKTIEPPPVGLTYPPLSVFVSLVKGLFTAIPTPYLNIV